MQDYVQSQASIAVQNYMAKQHQQIIAQSGVTSGVGGANIPSAIASPGVVNLETATALSSNARIRSISNATSIYPTVDSNALQNQKVCCTESYTTCICIISSL